MNITKEQAALARAVLKDFADEQRRKARVAFGNYKTSASTADKSAFMQANEAADMAEYVAKRMQASPPKQSTPQPEGGDEVQCPHCVEGIRPMTFNRPCLHCKGLGVVPNE